MTTTELAFQDPPVRAVELTLFFDTLPLKLTNMTSFMSQLQADFPEVEERFSLMPWATEARGPQFVPAGTGDFPFPWLTFSAPGGQSVSFQDDRFMLRWEFADGHDYPGYADLRESLEAHFTSFSDHAGETIALRRARAEYDNSMPPNAAWDAARRAYSVDAQPSAKRLDAIESSSAGGLMRFENEGFVTKVDFVAVSRVSSDSLSIRSTTSSRSEAAVDLSAIDEAHDRLIASFEMLTTPAQQQGWGRS